MTGAIVLFMIFGGAGVLRPIARAIAARISGEQANTERVRLLEAQLNEANRLAAQAEAERDRALEKADFMERLLARPGTPGGPPSLPPTV
ncbi:MAG: hypothetical protein JWM27_682 [Gemmatimonadetes bacterium]|nr:hypothetical protein [Gemmatimonadota bacterium]